MKERDAADVKEAVPPWAYLYGKLVMDNSRCAAPLHLPGCLFKWEGAGFGKASWS